MRKLLAAALAAPMALAALAAPAFAQEIATVAAQPDQAALEQWKADGVTTVINMRTPAEMAELGYDEQAAVEALGMKYVTVPFDREAVTPDITRALGKALDDASHDAGGGKVALHCHSGSRAANALAALEIERGEADPASVQSPQDGLTLVRSMLRDLSPRYRALMSRVD